jgi:hypothetical protein
VSVAVSLCMNICQYIYIHTYIHTYIHIRSNVLIMCVCYSSLGSNRLFELKSAAATHTLTHDFPKFGEAMSSVDNSMPWSVVQDLHKYTSTPSLMPPLPPGSLHCDDYDASTLMSECVSESVRDKVEELVPGSPLVGWLLMQSVASECVSECVSESSSASVKAPCLWVQGKYCNEGNNVSDAVQLAGLVGSIMGVLVDDCSSGTVRMRVPQSWGSLLGPPMSLSSLSMF